MAYFIFYVQFKEEKKTKINNQFLTSIYFVVMIYFHERKKIEMKTEILPFDFYVK